MTSGSREVLRFGDFELDVGAYELRRSGRPIRLEQQPMDLLILLLERRPELVTRREMGERLWGDSTFVEAEAGINTAVHKIRRALRDPAASPAFIERVPGKGYRFSGPVEVARVDSRSSESASGPRVAPALDASTRDVAFAECDEDGGSTSAEEIARDGNRRRRPALIMIAAIMLLVTAGAGAWLVRLLPASAPPKVQVLPLTRLGGIENHPSFSPDGNQLAFAWDGERQDNFDIYVTLVGSAEVRRLTTHPGADLAPEWSPDGRQIAYVRVQPPGTWHQLRVVSALGGSDRAVSDFHAWQQPSWSPDGRYLAAGRAPLPDVPAANRGIHLIPVIGGEPRALTQPGSVGSDHSPAFSPVGRRLAYASCHETALRMDCHVEVLSLDDSFRPVGQPRRLTRQAERAIRGITWSRDGGSLVYSAGYLSPYLWRIRADGSGPPERIEEASAGAVNPAFAPAANRLVFSRWFRDIDVLRVDRGPQPVAVARSSGTDNQPDFSPDGGRIAFCSDRSGSVEVWIAGTDGSSPSQLTSGPGGEQCSPAWSPDGQRIAFDSVDGEGFWQIWTIRLSDKVLQPVTQGAANHNVPSWSVDGQWIYFSRRQDATRNIWRAHVKTGRMEQLTWSGSGYFAHESADGAGIFYAERSTDDGPLFFQPLAGGAARLIVPCIAGGSTVSMRRQGIYFLPCRKDGESDGDQPVHVLNLSTGEQRAQGKLAGYHSLERHLWSVAWFRRTAVSPDGDAVLYQHTASQGADLMLIENFR